MDMAMDGERRAGSPEDATTGGRVELRAINEQLLLAGLREQELSERLRRHLAFINPLAEARGEGIIALDMAGHITFANPAAEQLLGWSAAELLGRALHEVIGDRHAAPVAGGVVVAGGDPRGYPRAQ